MKVIISAFVLLTSIVVVYGQSHKSYDISRIEVQPKIDGNLNDECWKLIPVITDFTQYIPVYNVSPTQRTSVRLAYDNEAIYIGAIMYDTSPDSIYRQLGNRDDELNSDYIAVKFDTYNLQTDAYSFVVWASGVQSDYREQDETYNAVWQSATKITDSGWICEIKIPYSAIRFPEKAEQSWGLEIVRSIRRNREKDQWALEVKGADNSLVYWGKLNNIKDIKAPVRLSLTPYVSAYAEHYPYNTEGVNNLSYSFSGGLDLKYGINESYTLDMTLLPDFSQVQSDDMVKNITAYETVYEENRSFFTEATDLFDKSDLFYSRRIGRVPGGFFSIYDSLKSGEYVYKNPGQARLLNATKISGRSKNGLAIGLFNAITNNMYAVVKDSNGTSRKVLTEPLTNYNIIVFDQVLKNNSSVYLINTNVIRAKGYDDANVTSGGIKLNNKSNTWQVGAVGGISQKFSKMDSVKEYKNVLGYGYRLHFGKVSGKLRFIAGRDQLNDTWDANDMGLTLTNGQTANYIEVSYSIYEPFWVIRDMEVSFSVKHEENFLTKYLEELGFEIQTFGTFKNYLTVWIAGGLSPFKGNDFYEPRSPGRFFVIPEYYYVHAGFSSDYRKKFALDLRGNFVEGIGDEFKVVGLAISPIVKAGNKFAFEYEISGEFLWNDRGYAGRGTIGDPLFGHREVTTVENALESRFMFKNDLSLGLRVRHYWSMGVFDRFYELLENGYLQDAPAYFGSKDYDFNYNTFYIDLSFNWQFAPGSNLGIVYKNSIEDEDNIVIPSYFENYRRTFQSPQENSISIKVLYYLDYLYLRGKRKKQ